MERVLQQAYEQHVKDGASSYGWRDDVEQQHEEDNDNDDTDCSR